MHTKLKIATIVVVIIAGMVFYKECFDRKAKKK